MKACFLAMLPLLLASSSSAQLPYTQEQAIAYAKSIDVQTLDPSLPSQRLEEWLQSGPPHAHIWSWRVADPAISNQTIRMWIIPFAQR
jgi:hypothetical protein